MLVSLSDPLDPRQLLECPESLRQLPAQAIQLSLTAVPLDRTDDLAGRADQMVRY